MTGRCLLSVLLFYLHFVGSHLAVIDHNPLTFTLGVLESGPYKVLQLGGGSSGIISDCGVVVAVTTHDLYFRSLFLE